MCGIAFAKGKELHRVLGRQRDRGLDGVGILSESVPGLRGFHPDRNSQGHYVSENVRFNWYVEYIQEVVKEHGLEDKLCLFHHRKGSVGSLSLENVHPVYTEKFSIMQNGTERLLRQWGDVEGIDSSKSDTFCLGQFLNSKAKKLEDIVKILDGFSDKLMDVGILLVREKKTNRILFYSDGKRESYLTFGQKKNTIDMIESWHGTDRRICHKNIGHMIFDFDGNISKLDIKDINEEYKAKTISLSYTNDEGVVCWNKSSYDYDTDYDCYSYSYARKEKQKQSKEDVIKTYLWTLKRSINKGDVRPEEIRELPDGLLESLGGDKAIKKFKKTYEQAIARAEKFAEKQSQSIIVYNNLINDKAKSEQKSIIDELSSDKTLADIIDGMDDKKKEESPNDDYEFNEEVWKKFGNFLATMDAKDIISDFHYSNIGYTNIKIESIDIDEMTIKLSQKSFFTTTEKDVQIFIDSDTESYYLYNPFEFSNKCFIRCLESTYEPILCKQ